MSGRLTEAGTWPGWYAAPARSAWTGCSPAAPPDMPRNSVARPGPELTDCANT